MSIGVSLLIFSNLFCLVFLAYGCAIIVRMKRQIDQYHGIITHQRHTIDGLIISRSIQPAPEIVRDTLPEEKKMNIVKPGKSRRKIIVGES